MSALERVHCMYGAQGECTLPHPLPTSSDPILIFTTAENQTITTRRLRFGPKKFISTLNVTITSRVLACVAVVEFVCDADWLCLRLVFSEQQPIRYTTYTGVLRHRHQYQWPEMTTLREGCLFCFYLLFFFQILLKMN